MHVDVGKRISTGIVMGSGLSHRVDKIQPSSCRHRRGRGLRPRPSPRSRTSVDPAEPASPSTGGKACRTSGSSALLRSVQAVEPAHRPGAGAPRALGAGGRMRAPMRRPRGRTAGCAAATAMRSRRAAAEARQLRRGHAARWAPSRPGPSKATDIAPQLRRWPVQRVERVTEFRLARTSRAAAAAQAAARRRRCRPWPRCCTTA
jgi:hypothetical protein